MKGLSVLVIVAVLLVGWVYRDRLPIIGMSGPQIGSSHGAEAYLMAISPSRAGGTPQGAQCSWVGTIYANGGQESTYGCSLALTDGTTRTWCVAAAQSNIAPTNSQYAGGPFDCAAAGLTYNP